MSDGFSVQWDTQEGATSGVDSVKFRPRLVRALTASKKGRVLSWSSKVLSPVLIPEALQSMQPSLLVALGSGGTQAARLCGLSGRCYIPPGVSCVVSLDSPRWALSTAAKLAWFYRFCPGSVDCEVGETDGPSLVDDVSLCLPVFADNHTPGQYGISSVRLDQVNGYSRYELTRASGGSLLPTIRGNACPWSGAVEQSGYACAESTDTIVNDLLAGYAVEAPSCTGFPMQRINQAAAYTGNPNVFVAGLLAFH